MVDYLKDVQPRVQGFLASKKIPYSMMEPGEQFPYATSKGLYVTEKEKDAYVKALADGVLKRNSPPL